MWIRLSDLGLTISVFMEKDAPPVYPVFARVYSNFATDIEDRGSLQESRGDVMLGS